MDFPTVPSIAPTLQAGTARHVTPVTMGSDARAAACKTGMDRVTFAGNPPQDVPPDADAYLDENDRKYIAPATKNLMAAKILARGSRGNAADPAKAGHFLALAMRDGDIEGAAAATLEAAKMLLHGYHALPRDEVKALALLKKLIFSPLPQSRNDKSFYALCPQAARIALVRLRHLLGEADVTAIETAYEKSVAFYRSAVMAAAAARFFAVHRDNPRKARQFARMTDRYDREQWVQMSKSGRVPVISPWAGQVMSLAEDFARGTGGLPVDKALAEELLESLLPRMNTHKPTGRMQAARLFARELDNPGRATEIADEILDTVYDPPYLDIAELRAEYIRDRQGAENLIAKVRRNPALLNEREKILLDPDKVQIARILAKLEQPVRARYELARLSFARLQERHKTETLLEMARLYAENLHAPDQAVACLREARSPVDNLEDQIRLAGAFSGISHDAFNALALLNEAFPRATCLRDPETTDRLTENILAVTEDILRHSPGHAGAQRLRDEVRAFRASYTVESDTEWIHDPVEA